MTPRPTRNSQSGVALVVALITLFVLSTLAAAIIFATQTGAWSSANYQRMLEARYAAEAGAQNTLNYLLYTYTPPTSSTGFDLTQYPVQYNGSAVVLSAMNGVTGNYPTASVQTNFNSALQDSSVPGLTTAATFEVTATLLTMQPAVFGNWLQEWQITSLSSVPGVRTAQVQVTMTVERRGTPLFTYAIAGTGTTCPTVNFTSSGTVDSWDSSKGTYAATEQKSGGNIGANGNVTVNTVIDGTISDAQNTNIGGCPSSGITNNVGGNPSPWLGLSKISTLVYPNPPAPSPMTPNVNINTNSNTCWGALPAGCTVIAGPAISIAPGTYGNWTSNSNVHLSAGTYNFNSIALNGGSVTLDSYPVVINLGGSGISAGGTLFTSNSSTLINDGGIPANLQIFSAATCTPQPSCSPPVVTMNSSSDMYALVYAPGAYVHVTGSSQFLGAVVGEKVTSDSSKGFSYDRSLQNNVLTPGAYYPISFSWGKF